MFSRRRRLGLRMIGPLLRAAGIPSTGSYPLVRRFVIVSTPRSGSSWLADVLNNHAQIICHSELFAYEYFLRPPIGGNQDVRTWNSYSAERSQTGTARDRLRLFFQYLDEQVFVPHGDAQIVGFKLLDYHAQRGFGIPAYLKARDVSIVHLIRRNHLDVLLSEEARIARSVSQARSATGVERVEIELDLPSLPLRLEARQQAVEADRQAFRSLKTPYHEVLYEDLQQDNGTFNQTVRFLGAEPEAEFPASQLVKLNPTSHRELIANYEDVQRTLQDTRFCELLR